MSDNDIILRKKARELLQAGKLPTRSPDRMWGGSGVQGQCALCRAPVEKGQLVYEVEFVRDGGGLANYHFHMCCFSALEAEIGKLGLANAPTFPADQAQSAKAAFLAERGPREA